MAGLICVRLVSSTGGRIRVQTVLDAAVALTALGVLLEMLVALTVGAATAPTTLLLTVGYPAISALLLRRRPGDLRRGLGAAARGRRAGCC